MYEVYLFRVLGGGIQHIKLSTGRRHVMPAAAVAAFQLPSDRIE